MLLAATSLSACRNVPPTCGSLADRYSGISFWGVMGYPKNSLAPALMAASPIASHPFMSFLATFALLVSRLGGDALACLEATVEGGLVRGHDLGLGCEGFGDDGLDLFHRR